MYGDHISVHVIRLVDKLKCVGLLLQINPLALKLDIYSLAHHLGKM